MNNEGVFKTRLFMPELPDLQIFSRNLNKQLAGKTLEKINVLPGARLNVAKAALKKSLESQKLVKVYREGKELRFVFQNGNILGLHLMLRGKLYWFEAGNQHNSTLLELVFKDGGLALTDYQRKAAITLNPPASAAPDALSKEVTSQFWKERLQSRAAIKNLLLDQHVIRGIGNAYADEILWDAGISPFSISNKLPPAKIKALASSVKKVLKKAEQQISKADPDIIGGEIRDFLLIHNAKKKSSPTGGAIKQKTAGARKTYYTDEQELFT
jgi:formamidopyrimidine-DNA glycosylase